jgi:hypothetical protein
MSRAIRPIRIEGDAAYVTLTKGYEAIIDAADVPLVEGKNWHADAKRRENTVYARTRARKGSAKKVWMHRVIMDDPDGFQVDHIDGNGLNNCRNNLRKATNAQNARNSCTPRNNTSGFKGVTWHKLSSKWCAKIEVNYVSKHLGLFDTPEAAHSAYVAASEKLHGEFGRVA